MNAKLMFRFLSVFYSKLAVFDGKKAIRGGIPFVFRKCLPKSNETIPQFRLANIFPRMIERFS